MKKNVFLFLTVAMLLLMILPVTNIIWGTPPKGLQWWRPVALYNLDLLRPTYSRYLYQVGISSDPGQVVIGRDHWLFLGDDHSQGLSIKLHPITAFDWGRIQETQHAVQSLEACLKKQGVRLFKVMIAPNKNSIYPEFLPLRYKPLSYSAINAVMDGPDKSIYVDTTPALLRAKTQFNELLYYKIDSHWNPLGAWVAFHAFMTEVAKTEKDVQWYPNQQLRVTKERVMHEGDLAVMLKMGNILKEDIPVLRVEGSKPVMFEKFNYVPLRIHNEHALNHARVLWIRDSFGISMEEWLAMAFTDTLQVHYERTNPEEVRALMETFKPDYVFASVVERHALDGWYRQIGMPCHNDLSRGD